MSRLLGIILRDDLGGILCRDNNDFRVLASYAHSADDDSILRHKSRMERKERLDLQLPFQSNLERSQYHQP